MFCNKLLHIFIGLCASCALVAQPSAQTTEHKEPFDAGGMIIDHILDNHEWHIMTIGETHVTIPLPILLVHNGKLHAFMSSKFHHGHQDYRNFRWTSEGPKNKGQILYIEPSGEVSEKRPLDLSITKNVLSLLFSATILFLLLRSIAKAYRKRGSAQAPTGLQNMIEPVILFVRDDIARSVLPEKSVDRFLPYLLTLFFFILFCNLLGLIPIFPGGANVTGNIAVTMVLALITFCISTFNGKAAYFRELVDTPGAPWWMKFPLPILPAIEIMGFFTKPLVLMIRLFANMMAGHIVVLGFVAMIFVMGNMNVALGYGTSVLSVALALFISALELIVAFVQAFVFTLLTSLYISAAIEEHH